MSNLYVTITARTVALADDKGTALDWRDYGYTWGRGRVLYRNPDRVRLRHDVILNAIANEALARGMNLASEVRRSVPAPQRKSKVSDRQRPLL